MSQECTYQFWRTICDERLWMNDGRSMRINEWTCKTEWIARNQAQHPSFYHWFRDDHWSSSSSSSSSAAPFYDFESESNLLHSINFCSLFHFIAVENIWLHNRPLWLLSIYLSIYLFFTYNRLSINNNKRSHFNLYHFVFMFCFIFFIIYFPFNIILPQNKIIFILFVCFRPNDVNRTSQN